MAGGLSKVRVGTWTGTYTADGGMGGDTPLVVSQDSVPVNSLVNALAMTVTSDFSACDANFLVWVQRSTQVGTFDGDNLADTYWNTFGNDPAAHTHQQTNDKPARDSAHLAVHAACADQSGQIAVPSFTYKVRFSVTPLATPGTLVFD